MTDTELVHQFIYLVGQITIIVLISLLMFGFVLLGLTYYSIRKGKLVFPRLLKAGIALLEGLMKALFRFFGLADREVLAFSVYLQNSLNKNQFAATPVNERAVFLPQCLRSAQCPASLAPEGIRCRSCGQCEVGNTRPLLEKLGYRVFIVPGSSFIKRMVREYRPRAIIGVGCLAEVKEGLEMAGSMGLAAMGVVNTTDGCVETSVNWDELFEIAVMGISPESLPPELARFSEKTSLEKNR
jgi:uncharacterized protein